MKSQGILKTILSGNPDNNLCVFCRADDVVAANNDTDDSWTTKTSSSGSRNSPLEPLLDCSSSIPDQTIGLAKVPVDTMLQEQVRPAIIEDIFSSAGDSPFMDFGVGAVVTNVSSSIEQTDSQGDNKGDNTDLLQAVSNGFNVLQVTDSEDQVNGGVVSGESGHAVTESLEGADGADDGIKGHSMSEQELCDC